MLDLRTHLAVQAIAGTLPDCQLMSGHGTSAFTAQSTPAALAARFLVPLVVCRALRRGRGGDQGRIDDRAAPQHSSRRTDQQGEALAAEGQRAIIGVNFTASHAIRSTVTREQMLQT